MRPKKSQRRFKFPMLSLDHIFLARKLHSAILGCNLWFKQPPAGPGEERRIAVFWHWLKEKHPIFYEVFWDVILLIAIAALIRSF